MRRGPGVVSCRGCGLAGECGDDRGGVDAWFTVGVVAVVSLQGAEILPGDAFAGDIAAGVGDVDAAFARVIGVVDGQVGGEFTDLES